MPGRFADIVAVEIARSESRALVPLRDDKPADRFDHLSGSRANFLAHLIATRDGLPQTTALRRETPNVAIFAYAHGFERAIRSRSRLA